MGDEELGIGNWEWGETIGEVFSRVMCKYVEMSLSSDHRRYLVLNPVGRRLIFLFFSLDFRRIGYLA